MGRTASDRSMLNFAKRLVGCATLPVGTTSRPPKWIKPQLTRTVWHTNFCAPIDHRPLGD